MRKISSLKPGDRHVDVEGVISDLSEIRIVKLRRGGEARVVDATLSDESDSIRISLWNDDIDKVKEGVRVRVENGYVTSFRGKRQLNVGLYGRLVVLTD